MIQVQRPINGPSILKRLGEKQTSFDCTAYDACPADYHSGKASFQKRKREYYSDKEVKDLLVKMHNSKCCYCEKKLWSPYLHVEHFRPKGGVRQALDQKNDEPPGYYWLAYRWENLLLSCHDCNSRFKRTFFPLANPAERARSHHDDLTREHPLFVDPAGQDPRDHIRFDGHTPKGLTRQGHVTVEGIGLRRAELTEARLKCLKDIRFRYAVLVRAAKYRDDAELQAMAKEALDVIEAAKRPDAEFSSMVIDYVAPLGL